METGKECFCCQEMVALNEKLDTGIECIVEHEDFTIVCLNRAVLRTALIAMSDVAAETISDPLTNRILRLAAYRQFVWWTHRRLGKTIRIILPACVVTRIREEFPAPDGLYVGFLESTNDGMDNTGQEEELGLQWPA
eukprot:m.312083 g.312083  ORF g.312083 m.312083 type:complete len:137 (+) comp209694_c0_seq1:266-676(+)